MTLSDMPMYYAGGGFPWGLLIIGGILYFVWRSGMFGGPGRYGNGRFGGPGSGFGPMQSSQDAGSGHDADVFRGPHAVFDDWHRQAHETPAAPPQARAPAASATPPAPPTAAAPEVAASGDGELPR